MWWVGRVGGGPTHQSANASGRAPATATATLPRPAPMVAAPPRCACCAGELSGANLEYLQRNTQTLILIGSTDEVRGWMLTVRRPHGDEVL